MQALQVPKVKAPPRAKAAAAPAAGAAARAPTKPRAPLAQMRVLTRNKAEASMREAERLEMTPAKRRQLMRLKDGVGLGYYAMHYLRLKTPRCHQRWYQAFDLHRRLLFLAPRSHGKSIAVGRVLVGHRILTDRNIRILIVSRTKGAASKTVRLVRQDLERNRRIINDWSPTEAGGPFRDPTLPWTDSLFYVARPKSARDPTLECVGVGGSITGGRFDLIIIDDPEDDKSVLSARQRQKTVEWLRGTILELLDTNGRVVVIGTRKHAADLYATLENDPTFAMLRDQAFVTWPDLSKVQWIEREDPETGRVVLEDVVVPPEAGGEALWSEKWPLKELLKKYRSLGSVMFRRENQNEITDDGASPFRKAWLDASKGRGASMGFLRWGWDDENDCAHPHCEGLYVWQCADLALNDDVEKAQEADSDFTVVQTWGLDWRTGHRTLLRMVRRRGLTQGQINALLISEARLFPQSIGFAIERNAFGKLITSGLKRTTDLPIEEHLTTGKKHDLFDGVPGMSVLFENGKITLPGGRKVSLPEDEADPRAGVDVLYQELHGIGREAHDDTVMCMWIGDVWIRRFIRNEEHRRRTFRQKFDWRPQGARANRIVALGLAA